MLFSFIRFIHSYDFLMAWRRIIWLIIQGKKIGEVVVYRQSFELPGFYMKWRYDKQSDCVKPKLTPPSWGGTLRKFHGKLLCLLLYNSRTNPYPPLGRSSEIRRGWEILKAKILEAKYNAKLEFPGEREGAKQENLWGGGGGEYGYFLELHIASFIAFCLSFLWGFFHTLPTLPPCGVSMIGFPLSLSVWQVHGWGAQTELPWLPPSTWQDAPCTFCIHPHLEALNHKAHLWWWNHETV